MGLFDSFRRDKTVKKEEAEVKGFLKFEDQTATICREVPILTTTSDKAYFVGAIA